MLKTNEGPTLEGYERNTGRTGTIVAQDLKVVSDGGADRSVWTASKQQKPLVNQPETRFLKIAVRNKSLGYDDQMLRWPRKRQVFFFNQASANEERRSAIDSTAKTA